MQPFRNQRIQWNSLAVLLGVVLAAAAIVPHARAGHRCDGDADGDGMVGPNDGVLVASCIGEEIAGICEDADINSDGRIDIADGFSWAGTFQRRGCAACFACGCIGDLDGDGIIGPADIALVAGCVGRAEAGRCAETDINCDGFVNSLDADAVVALFSGLPADVACPVSLCDGDADRNGSVEILDILFVINQLGESISSGNEFADINNDGVINLLDLDAVACRFSGAGTECCFCPCLGDIDGDWDVDDDDVDESIDCKTTQVYPTCDVNCDQNMDQLDVSVVRDCLKINGLCECCADCNRNDVPDPLEPTTTLWFEVTGTATDDDWSWEIRDTSAGVDFSYRVPDNGKLDVGAGGPLFAEAFARSINNNACASIVAKHCPCDGDVDGDGSVEISDILAMLPAVGHHPSGPFEGFDVNCDGKIDDDDVDEVQDQFASIVTNCVLARNKFSITVPGAAGFEFGVGSAGVAPASFMPPDDTIIFNPVISHICSPSSVPEDVKIPDSVGGNPLKTLTTNRTLIIRAGDAGGRFQAIRVTFKDLAPPYDFWKDESLFVGEPVLTSNLGGSVIPVPGTKNHYWSRLEAQPTSPGAVPECRDDWHLLGDIHVYHECILPSSEYAIQVVDCTDVVCVDDDRMYSDSLLLETSLFGDVVRDATITPNPPPEGVINIIDVLVVIRAFGSAPDAPRKARADLEPRDLDRIINITDALQVLMGFGNLPYPFSPSVDACLH